MATILYWNQDTGTASSDRYLQTPPQISSDRGEEDIQVIALQGTPPVPVLLDASLAVGIVIRDPANLKAGCLAGPTVLTRGATPADGYTGTTSTDTTYTRGLVHCDPSDPIPEVPSFPASAALYRVPTAGGRETEGTAFAWTVTAPYYRPDDPPADVVENYPSAAALTTAVAQASTAIQPNASATVTSLTVTQGATFEGPVTVPNPTPTANNQQAATTAFVQQAAAAARTGDGSGLTNLNASALTSGMLSTQRLDPSVAVDLVAKISHSIDARIVGATSATATNWNLFSTYSLATNPPTLVPNPTCWAAGLDLSGVAASSAGSNTFPVTAISPWHVAMAAHVYGGTGSGNGQVFWFLPNDGSAPISRTLVGVNNAFSDIDVGLLNAALPANVTPLPLLPPDWPARLGGNLGKLGSLVFNQFRQALIGEVAPSNVVNGVSNGQVLLTIPATSPRSLFGQEWVVGDSSSPAFLLLGNQPFLLTVAWSGGAGNTPGSTLGGGLDYAYYTAQIAAAMAALGPASVTLAASSFPAAPSFQWGNLANIPNVVLNPPAPIQYSLSVGATGATVAGSAPSPVIYVSDTKARLALTNLQPGQEVEESNKGVRFRLLRPFPSDPRAWSCLDLDALLMDAVRDVNDGSPMVDSDGQIVVDDVTPGWLSTVRDDADLSPVFDSTDGSVVTSY